MDIYNEGIESFRRHYGGFQTKFLLIIISTVIAAWILSGYFLIWVIVIHSFFIPQIYLNAKHGYKFAVKTPVLILFLVSRMAVLLYYFGCPANFLAIAPRYEFCAVICVYMILQFGVLMLQNSRVGPRFFVPKFLRPKIYSYYRTLEEELQIDESTDCIICMTPLNLLGKENEEAVNRSKTMHAPCGHKFHEDCLMNWMAIKMECPTCRKALPLIEE